MDKYSVSLLVLLVLFTCVSIFLTYFNVIILKNFEIFSAEGGPDTTGYFDE